MFFWIIYIIYKIKKCSPCLATFDFQCIVCMACAKMKRNCTAVPTHSAAIEKENHPEPYENDTIFLLPNHASKISE